VQAKDIDAHLRYVGTWVDWERSCDRFYAGDPATEVTGIAVCWLSALGALRQAHEAGCNLFIMHEPLFVGEADPEQHIGPDDPWVQKQRWLQQTGMVVYRCHDVWDDYPEVGIHGAWAKWLGFDGKPVAAQKFYEVHDVTGRTVGELARQVAARTAQLGQDCVHVIGDLDRAASRIALGTGAITNYRVMHGMGADVLVLTDDGTRLWESAQWARDSGVALLIVNHATAEEPGMRTLADYLAKQFSLPVKQIPVGCLYRTIK